MRCAKARNQRKHQHEEMNKQAHAQPRHKIAKQQTLISSLHEGQQERGVRDTQLAVHTHEVWRVFRPYSADLNDSEASRRYEQPQNTFHELLTSNSVQHGTMGGELDKETCTWAACEFALKMGMLFFMGARIRAVQHASERSLFVGKEVKTTLRKKLYAGQRKDKNIFGEKRDEKRGNISVHWILHNNRKQKNHDTTRKQSKEFLDQYPLNPLVYSNT